MASNVTWILRSPGRDGIELYWGGGSVWSKNPYIALRFSRRHDAEVAREIYFVNDDNVQATEMRWDD